MVRDAERARGDGGATSRPPAAVDPSATPDRRAALTGGLAALAGLAFAGGASASTRADDDVRRVHVVLVRHAEKQAGDDPELTEAGHAAAARLAALLGGSGVTHLEHSPFRRTAQTLAPLAEASGVEPTVTDPRDVDGLADRLRALSDGAVAVVAGHSNTIPAAVAALGGAVAGGLDARGFLPEEVYDRVFVVTTCRAGDGPWITSTLELHGP